MLRRMSERAAAFAVERASARPLAVIRSAHWALAGVVAVSTLGWSALALLSHTPWIFPDELLYSEVARSIASGHAPAVRGVTDFGYGIVYPALIAPAWAVTKNTEATYAIARVLGAVLMSLTAVPTFFLARRFTSERKALLVAVFAVLVPSMAYSGTLLTEVALYPFFMLAVLGITAAVDAPSRRNQLLALVAIGLAFGIKALSVVLVAAYVAAILIFAWFESRGGASARDLLRRFRLTWYVLVAAAGIGLVGGAVVSGSAFGFLGSYSVVAGHIDILGAIRWFLGNLAGLDLYVSAAPLVAFVVVVIRATSTRASRERRLFGAVSVPAVVLVLATVGAYGSTPTAGAAGFSAATPLRERNFFMVAPLLLLALAMWLDDRDRRGHLLPAACVLGVLGVAAYPWGSAPVAAGPQNLAIVSWIILGPTHAVRVLLVTLWAAVCVALLRFCRWDRIGRLWIALAAAFVFAGMFSSLVFANASSRSLEWGAGDNPSWIDRAVGPGARVDVLWQEPGSGFAPPLRRHRIVWVGELFNGSVGSVYALGAHMPYNLPDTSVRLKRGLVVEADGRPLRADYVLALCRTGVIAPVVAVNERVHAAIYRTAEKPLRLRPTRGTCVASRTR